VKKKTWTLRALDVDVVETMRTAPSLGAAAKGLGVDKSTVFRWVKSKRIPPPGGRRRRVGLPAAPGGWAAAIRQA
jgi:hypothetical protein